MKKKPNKTVAKLRKLIGKTQEQFAVMLGVSKDTIVSVENGRNRLTPGLASRIHVATGASPSSLLANTGVLMVADHYGHERGTSEYTKGSFEKWRKDVFGPNPDDPASRKRAAQFFFDMMKGRLEVLLMAASRPGLKGKDRFPAVLQSLEQWINYVYEDFELAKEVEEVLREETAFPVTSNLSVGFLRDAMKKGNPMKFKFKDSKKFKDSDVIEVTYDHFDQWDDPYIPSPERTKSKPPVRPRKWDSSLLFPELDSKKFAAVPKS